MYIVYVGRLANIYNFFDATLILESWWGDAITYWTMRMWNKSTSFDGFFILRKILCLTILRFTQIIQWKQLLPTSLFPLQKGSRCFSP